LEVALEIEPGIAGTEYEATPRELAAIDQGFAEEAVCQEEVEAAFTLFRKP